MQVRDMTDTPHWETYCDCGRCMLCQAVDEVKRLRMRLGEHTPELTKQQLRQFDAEKLHKELRTWEKANGVLRSRLAQAQAELKQAMRR